MANFKFKYANGGKDSKNPGFKFARYEMICNYGSAEQSYSYAKKKTVIKKYIAENRSKIPLMHRARVLHIHKIYQYPGFEVKLSGGNRLIFTEYAIFPAMGGVKCAKEKQ